MEPTNSFTSLNLSKGFRKLEVVWGRIWGRCAENKANSGENKVIQEKKSKSTKCLGREWMEDRKGMCE